MSDDKIGVSGFRFPEYQEDTGEGYHDTEAASVEVVFYEGPKPSFAIMGFPNIRYTTPKGLMNAILERCRYLAACARGGVAALGPSNDDCCSQTKIVDDQPMPTQLDYPTYDYDYVVKVEQSVNGYLCKRTLSGTFTARVDSDVNGSSALFPYLTAHLTANTTYDSIIVQRLDKLKPAKKQDPESKGGRYVYHYCVYDKHSQVRHHGVLELPYKVEDCKSYNLAVETLTRKYNTFAVDVESFTFLHAVN